MGLINSLTSHVKNFLLRFKLSSARSSTRPFTHKILWVTLLFFVIFIIWAHFAVIEEATNADATVIPLSQVQSIQNMEGGIIKQILVHEGEVVAKGQILVYLDPTRFTSSLHEAEARAIALEIKIARLTAEIENKPFVIKDNWRTTSAEMVSNQELLFKSRQTQLQQMNKNLQYAQQELNMTEPLVKEGAVSPVEVLRLKRGVADINNQISDFNSRALSELEAAKADFSILQASMLAIKDRLDRTTIRSPVKGVVKQIRTPTKEGVILPGMEIMSIVPLEDVLLVEAKVKPADIGFIHQGQPAMVKITAYDYSIFGGLEGVVDQISADTITNEKGESYYLVRVKTRKNYLRTPQNPLYIIPGMTASVNILTGKRTLLNYLLSPLIKAKEKALRER